MQIQIRAAFVLVALLTALPAPAQTVVRPSQSSIQPSIQPSIRLKPVPIILDLPSIRPVLPETDTVRLVLKLAERRVYVYQGDTVKQSYPVAVGRPGWETPTGSFKVTQMLEHPGWTNPFTGEKMAPSADNPLGDRWIAFWTDGTNSIGFHGTPNRSSVGTAASHGCVRMLNEHIRELFKLVKIGTPVTVEP